MGFSAAGRYGKARNPHEAARSFFELAVDRSIQHGEICLVCCSIFGNGLHGKKESQKGCKGKRDKILSRRNGACGVWGGSGFA